MFGSYGLIVQAALLVGGLWWCKEMWGRRHSDISELKESDDNVRKGVIVFFWLLTVPIAALVANFLWALISNMIDAFG